MYKLQLNRMFILEYKINIKGNEYYNVSLLNVPNKVPMENTETLSCLAVIILLLTFLLSTETMTTFLFTF